MTEATPNPYLDQLAQQIAGAKTYGSGGYIEPGNYIFELEEVIFYYSEKDATNWFIVSGVVKAYAGHPKYDIVPGAKLSWRCNMTKNTGAPNAKVFFDAAAEAALEDYQGPQSVTAKFVKDITAANQPLEGCPMKIRAYHVPNKKSGGVFTKLEWFTMDKDLDMTPVTVEADALETKEAPAQ